MHARLTVGGFRTKTSALAKVKGKGEAKYDVWDELVGAGTLAQAGGTRGEFPTTCGAAPFEISSEPVSLNESQCR